MKKRYIVVLALGLMGCQQPTKNSNRLTNGQDSLGHKAFQREIDGKAVRLLDLKNADMSVSLTNYGARLVSLNVLNSKGEATDVILGYDSAEEYKANTNNFYGAIVGRFANRIGNAKFSIGDQVYTLEKNDGEQSLHGGTNGLYNKVWDIKQVNDSSATLAYRSVDGEAGYPGNLDMEVTYTLTSNNGLMIDFRAETDKETVINLTNHAYFNLNGAGDSSILDHQLQIDAAYITAVDKQLIPTGKQRPVAGTAFDFNEQKTIGKDINLEDPQLAIGKGYDHNFVLNKTSGFQKVAALYSPKTHIQMDVWTTEPGLQFYSGNFMNAEDPKGKAGKTYAYRSALCLETQHFPDSPNQPDFPSTHLKPGDSYESKTAYYFTIRK